MSLTAAPFRPDTQVRVALEPGGGRDFDAFAVQITPGSAMRPDRDTLERMRQIDPRASELSLSCEGEGGDCGTAAVTTVRISTTDGDIQGLPPVRCPSLASAQSRFSARRPIPARCSCPQRRSNTCELHMPLRP